ncbi:MAG: GAF domain-containing protein [Spirochaetes bacterium]|nr:GAF domain-containing protein [Spirochaetota bacterium]
MKRFLYRTLFFFGPDLLFALFVAFILTSLDGNRVLAGAIAAGVVSMVAVRAVLFRIGSRFYYAQRIDAIRGLVEEYKKGRYIVPKIEISGRDELLELYGDMRTLGKHLSSVINSQKTELEKFQNLYNSIVFSLSTYYLILNGEDKIVFANTGLCEKFNFEQNEIVGKRIEDIFYFVNRRLKEGLRQVRKYENSVLLEKTHLLSMKKVSIIADIKISNIVLQEKRHEIVVIDDVTNRLQKDYQISLMSQITESIQKDDEIDRILHTILTGVTSGAGLGFNRAMLFLLDEKSQTLHGKMAVGPDSFEEAIEIWSSIASRNPEESISADDEKASGKALLKNVMNASFGMDQDSVFTRAMKTMMHIHVLDLWNEQDISEEIRALLNVKEFVIVPLVAVNRSIGVVVADNKFNKAPIGKGDIELLSIFASQAALSIENYVQLDSVRNEMQKLGQRQDAIVESEKLAAIGRISAHIAHEIRNPLVTMGGYARRIFQLARDREKGKDVSGIKDAAMIILNESERLEKILSNVMDFTRPSRYIREFNNINEVIEDTVNLLKNLFLEKKINVETNLETDVPLIKCDFNQMKQVMLNLLQNSIDVTGPGGRIVISSESTAENIVVRVMDSGSGIDQEDTSVVFEPFFTTKVTGVGLGLAIVKKIIKDHGGDISVRNITEGGSEFVIILPVPV